jgi:hypothetical protein
MLALWCGPEQLPEVADGIHCNCRSQIATHSPSRPKGRRRRTACAASLAQRVTSPVRNPTTLVPPSPA